jgi:predicted nucleotidyltransferase
VASGPASEALLELAADILGPLVDEVVFVGGATVHLWLTEAAAPPVRATDDVDVICDVTSYAEYQALSERLRERGLEEAIDEPVICRWRHRDSGLAIDVMPTSEDVLGFSNPWYEAGIATAVELKLPSGKRIRAVAPPVVVATKLAAWLGRGGGDVLASLDVHDIVVLIDGRPELIDELAAQPEELREYVAAELASLREVNYFEYVVQGAVAAYGDVANERATILAERLDAIIARLRPA